MSNFEQVNASWDNDRDNFFFSEQLVSIAAGNKISKKSTRKYYYKRKRNEIKVKAQLQRKYQAKIKKNSSKCRLSNQKNFNFQAKLCPVIKLMFFSPD